MSIAPTHPTESREEARNLYYNSVPGWPGDNLGELASEQAESARVSPARQVWSNNELWCVIVVAQLSDEELDEKLAAFEEAVDAAGGLNIIRDGVDGRSSERRHDGPEVCPLCSGPVRREAPPPRADWTVCWYVAYLPEREVRRLVEETLGPL